MNIGEASAVAQLLQDVMPLPVPEDLQVADAQLVCVCFLVERVNKALQVDITSSPWLADWIVRVGDLVAEAEECVAARARAAKEAGR